MHNAMLGLFSLGGGEIILILAMLMIMAAGLVGVILFAIWLASKHWSSTPAAPRVQPAPTAAHPRSCPRCGAPLPADAPEGLCPRCVLGVGLATHTDAPGDSVSHGTKPLQPPPAPADIAKHFPHLEILECLGRGGMGAVYKARQPKLNRLVALKVLAPEKGADPRFAERFSREAQALARLSHPNIVTVHDFGEADGLYYLLMEYVDGVTLRQLLQTHKMAPEEALKVVPKICEALQFAHEQGIVHRDIKPENVLLDKQGRVKIADFGIAKLVGTEAPRLALTEEQAVIGTPHYMAPEQVEKPQLVDHRADIYSVGVVFYEMLTGELPLGKFQPPSKKVEVDVRLDEVVLHALEKEPERRYQQASQVKTDVETIAATPGSPAGTGKTPPPVRLMRFRDAWPWNWEYIQLWLSVPMVLVGVAIPVCWRWCGAHALWLLFFMAGGIIAAPIYAAVGRRVGRKQAAALRTSGEVAQCLMFRRPFQSPGVAVLREDRLELVPIIGQPIIVPFADITAVKEVKWFNGTRLWFKKGFVMELANGQRVGVAVAEVFARRWRARLSRGSLPEIKESAGAATATRQPHAEDARPPRLSRAALWGAIWAPWFFFVGAMYLIASRVVVIAVYGDLPRGPAWWEVVLSVTLLPIGAAAPFSTTILGWVAVAQIRRSAGRLYGLRLAVFDGLLFPLLALGGLIVWVAFEFRLRIVMGIIIAIGVVALLAFLIWRKVKQSAVSCTGLAAQPGRKRSVALWVTGACLVLGLGAMLLFLSNSVNRYAVPTTTDLAEQPQKLRKLPTDKVIAVGLEKPGSAWAWSELTQRAKKGRLSAAEAGMLVDGLAGWIRRDYPDGYREPLPWLGPLLDELGKRKLVSQAQEVRFLRVFQGNPRLAPPRRLREGQQFVGFECWVRNVWHRNLFGLVMLNEVRSITVDGERVPLPPGVHFSWRSDVASCYLEVPDLAPGKHTLKCEVESALAPESDLAGLPNNAPSTDWPRSIPHWTRAAEAELEVFPKDAQIVRLTQDPALDPVANGALAVKAVIIRPQGDRLSAVVLFDVNNKLRVPISADVTLRLAGQSFSCGGFYYCRLGKGSTYSGKQLSTELDALDQQIKEAEVILSPNPKLVEPIPGVDVAWGKEIAFHHVPLTRQDLTQATSGSVLVSPLQVVVDPRVELLSLIFRLAGNPEYNQARVASYAADADKQFKAFREHPVVKLARQLRKDYGVSYDACMSLAVHLTDAYDPRLTLSLDPWPEGLDQRWPPKDLTNFLVAARQFVKDSAFKQFIEQHLELYQTTESRMRTLMTKEAHLEWFNQYYGEHPQAAFTVVPALLNGGCCYGVHCRDAAGRKELFCVLGVWKTGLDGLPVFDHEMLGTVVHEFSHSYANPIIDRHEAELAAAGTKLYAPVAAQMRSQGYSNPLTMLRESLVRACAVRYQRQYEGEQAARRAIQHEKSHGFLWTEELSSLLAVYEAQRERYPTLEAFAPRLVEFFYDYAKDFGEQQALLAAKRPKVVSMTPANGASNVDPGLKEITVVFNQPMKNSWAMVGGGPHYPETAGKPHYDARRTTWTVPVKLKPNWRYEFRLNLGEYDTFRSEEDVPLEPVLVTFTTGKQARSP